MSTGQKIHGTGQFVSESVRIVDYDSENNNLLVRGSAAFGANNFQISDLVSAIKADEYYKSIGITLGSNPMIVDFCLIGYGPSNTKDKNIVGAEVQWFDPTRTPPSGDSPGTYPICIASSSGSVMVYWPVLAIGGEPPTTPGGKWDKATAASAEESIDASGYNFAGLVPAMFNALSNKPSQIAGFPASTPITNAVVYVHCDSGVNRTGAAVIAYLMQYGSNISAFGVSSQPVAPYHTLQDGQNAALVSPPGNDSPPGGVDQGVSEAYCNLLNHASATAHKSSSPSATDLLSANCVPILGSV